jgi:hypothetical protein
LACSDGVCFQNDDALAASPVEVGGKSVQTKLGSDAAQFVAEGVDGLGRGAAGDLRDRAIELQRGARPIDTLPGESEREARRRRVFEKQLSCFSAVISLRSFTLVLDRCRSSNSAHWARGLVARVSFIFSLLRRDPWFSGSSNRTLAAGPLPLRMVRAVSGIPKIVFDTNGLDS